MAKYAVMVVLDLDIEVLDSMQASAVEKITETRVRTALEVDRRRIGIKILRTKLLGKAE